MYFKSLFAAAASAALLMSCAKDTQIESALEANNTIGFRSAITRGTEITNTTLDRFFVTAVKDAPSLTGRYFEDVPFVKHGSEFTSSESYKWPGYQLKFLAYSPSKSELGVGKWSDVSIDWEQKKLKNFGPNPMISKQVDFITASATATGPTTVPLNFEHQLSQIEIKAKSTSSIYTYKVKGIRIASVRGKATSFDFLTNQWEFPDTRTKVTYSVKYPDEVTLSSSATSLMGRGGNAMLLPQPLIGWDVSQPTNHDGNSYLAVLLQISTSTGQFFPKDNSTVQYEWAAVSLPGNWEAGKKYIYVLDFSDGAGNVDPMPDDPSNNHPGEEILGEPIKFTVEVAPWKPVDILM